MLFAVIWWIVDARKWFKGPKVSPVGEPRQWRSVTDVFQVNIEHAMLGRIENVIAGKENPHDSEGSSAGSSARERAIDDKKAVDIA